MLDLDAADRRILSSLQEDASLTIAELSDLVGMSQNACWRRMRKLEEKGIILRRIAVLDAEKLGFNLTVFVSIRASEHSEQWFDGLRQAVKGIPEVMEFYRMAGETDYLLKLKVENMSAYDRVYRRLIESVRLNDVSSSFAMEEIKFTSSLPLQ